MVFCVLLYNDESGTATKGGTGRLKKTKFILFTDPREGIELLKAPHTHI